MRGGVIYMKSAVISLQGGRASMEDFYYFERNFLRQGLILGLICDGHFGKFAAEYTANNLPDFIFRYYQTGPVKDVFTKAYQEISREIERIHNSGTTALSFLIKDRTIICANAGDSRLIIVRKKGILQLTEDHRVNNRLEKKRIVKLGGKISGYYACREGEGLMPTRTIGDAYFKPIGIISTPEIYIYYTEENDLFLIAGTDGLFDPLKNKEVAEIARKSVDPEKIIRNLAKEADRRDGGDDNKTIIAVSLK